MPTPLDILTDPVSLIIIGMYLGLFLWESIFPARSQPRIKNWILYGVLMFMIYFYLSSYLPLLTDQYLIRFQLLDIRNIPVAIEVLIGILLFQLGLYVWHRSMHRNNFLWRIFHQMHHSVERIDMPSAFIFSPFDMIGFTVLGSICSVLLIGLSPEATTLTLLINSFIGMFQHANIRTPVWLGYIVQRPESHSIHHAKGVHAYNYSDLPLFDILFGTFRNPKEFNEQAGFYMGASSRIGPMLLFRDISDEPA
jgi:sterol desaturase/sphingolipid hydroxylase (fatty acid hydroxylase superfamily)